MAQLAIGLGILLVVMGVGGFAGTGASHFTALIPAVLGIPILICGLLARDEARRKHAMHAALALALLGFLGTLRGLMHLPLLLSGGDVKRPVAVWDQAITAALCAAFVAVGVKSFMQARRDREAR